MNDKPQTGRAKAFDPAEEGWEAIVNHTAFGDLVGPIWRREEDGQPRFGFVVAPKHLNRAGNLHGGIGRQRIAFRFRVACLDCGDRFRGRDLCPFRQAHHQCADRQRHVGSG